MSSLCQNPEIFICMLYLVTICSDSASYFLEMSILIILVGALTQIRMGLGCIISWYRVKEGAICLPYVKI